MGQMAIYAIQGWEALTDDSARLALACAWLLRQLRKIYCTGLVMRRASSQECPVQSAGEGQMAINALQVSRWSLPAHSMPATLSMHSIHDSHNMISLD